MSRRPCSIALFASFVLFVPSAASAVDDQDELLKVVRDEQAKPPDREAALLKATKIEFGRPLPREGPFRSAMGDLLKALAPHAKDVAYSALIERTFQALTPLRPYADLGPRVKPYLAADVPPVVREDALHAISFHGASGLAKELKALFGEDLKDAAIRVRLERAAIDAAAVAPPAEAFPVLQAAVAVGHPRPIRVAAVHALAALSDPASLAELKTASLATEKLEEVACAAAIELQRRGSLDGIGELVKRILNTNSFLAYQALCTASYHQDGFAGTPVLKWNRVDQAARTKVLDAIREWWAATQSLGADGAFFRTLEESGLTVPKDTSVSNKDIIPVLLDALDLEPRSLRNTALDILVKRTGRKEFEKDWHTLSSSIGFQLQLGEGEPADGFADARRAGLLREQQRGLASKWRQWWLDAGPNAALVNGVWVTAGQHP